MSLTFEPADIQYIAYIDEAGDPGLNKVRPIDPNGASEWLSIGAIVIQADREGELVPWVQAIRQDIRARQRPDLHFRDLNEAKKSRVCAAVADLPLRCFVLLSNKKNMRGHQNPRAANARPSGQQWFYNWCIRLLLERVTDFVERHSLRHHGKPKHVQLIFSERGGVRYGQTAAYHDLLKNQARSDTTYLTKRIVRWRVLHPSSSRIVRHDKNAGVQLADVVASAFFQAADTSLPNWNVENAKLLSPRIPIENGRWADYGVVLQPAWRQARLTADQEQIFRFYGYPLN
jgi:hypothetical protein